MKRILWLLVALAVLAAAALWFFNTYTLYEGKLYRQDSAFYDLRGRQLSAREYDALRARFPQSQILWDVPFQGRTYPMDINEITLNALTDEDVEMLSYLEKLTVIHAETCRDYPQLMKLIHQRPECRVLYTVPIGGKDWDCNSEALEADASQLDELETAIPLLPNASQVRITGDTSDWQALNALADRFPDITFLWNVTVADRTIDCEAQTADLSGLSLRGEDLAALFRPLTGVKRFDLRGTGVTEEQLRPLFEMLPDAFFLWDMDFYGQTITTDAEEIDISGTEVTDIPALEDKLCFLPRLRKLIMTDCGISNEDMDALNRRHADIQIVWTVQVGFLKVRTDETTFMPTRHNVWISEADAYNLRYCTEMVVVDVGHHFVRNCQWAAFMPHLKFLVIGETGISDITPLTGLTELIYLEMFTIPVTDYSPLVTCTALEDLNLGLTYGSPDPIAQMPWLKNLYWCDALNRLHPDTARAQDILPEALPDTELCFYLDHPNAGDWRHLPNYYAMRDLLEMPYLNQ